MIYEELFWGSCTPHSLSIAVPSAPLLVAMAMPSAPLSLSFSAFLALSLCPLGSVPPAFLPLLGCPAVLPGLPVLIVALSTLTVEVGRHTVSLPALPVPVAMAVTPAAMPLWHLLALQDSQRCAAEAMLHTGFPQLARPPTVWPTDCLMTVVVVRVGGSAVMLQVLAAILLIQRQLTRLCFVGVVVTVVLRVDNKGTIQVGLHITTSFSWVRHLG